MGGVPLIDQPPQRAGVAGHQGRAHLFVFEDGVVDLPAHENA
jgi:hypothetical protein